MQRAQVWASTKPNMRRSSSLGDCPESCEQRDDGGPIHGASLYAAILNNLGVKFEEGQPIPVEVGLGESAAPGEGEGGCHSHADSRPGVLSSAAAVALSSWWRTHGVELQSCLGYELAAHVHAGAATAAAANVFAGKFRSPDAPDFLELLALHTLAIKFFGGLTGGQEVRVGRVVAGLLQGSRRVLLTEAECRLMAAAQYRLA